MAAFIISPKGKLIDTGEDLHLLFFYEHLMKEVSPRQMKAFYKVLGRTPPDDDQIVDAFKAFIKQLAIDQNHQLFYSGASAMGYICGRVSMGSMYIRVNSFEDIMDIQVKPLLGLLVKNNVKGIMVDFVNGNKYGYQEFTMNEFIEKL